MIILMRDFWNYFAVA